MDLLDWPGMLQAFHEIPRFFYWGVVGSLSAEVASALKECKDLGGVCPPLYKSAFYLVVRVLVAIAAGVFPIALDAQNALTAFYLGISAPVALDRLSRGLQIETNPVSRAS
jgi:hypothetical protein